MWIDSFLRGQRVREQGWTYGFGYIVVDQCILIEDMGLTLFMYTFCIYCMSGFRVVLGYRFLLGTNLG